MPWPQIQPVKKTRLQADSRFANHPSQNLRIDYVRPPEHLMMGVLVKAGMGKNRKQETRHEEMGGNGIYSLKNTP